MTTTMPKNYMKKEWGLAFFTARINKYKPIFYISVPLLAFNVFLSFSQSVTAPFIKSVTRQAHEQKGDHCFFRLGQTITISFDDLQGALKITNTICNTAILTGNPAI